MKILWHTILSFSLFSLNGSSSPENGLRATMDITVHVLISSLLISPQKVKQKFQYLSDLHRVKANLYFE